jgi:hypothetical protein
MPGFLIRTVPWHEERYAWALDLQRKLPGAELIEDPREDDPDREPSGYLTFMLALERQGTDDAWLIEDDAELSSRFLPMAQWAIQCHPDAIIQAFSTAGDEESRWRSGRSFGSNLCVYYPGRLAAAIHEFGSTWQKASDRKARYSDLMVRDFLTRRQMRYWNQVPCLATHREGRSMRSGRYWHARRAVTFVR